MAVVVVAAVVVAADAVRPLLVARGLPAPVRSRTRKHLREVAAADEAVLYPSWARAQAAGRGASARRGFRW